MDSDSPEKCFKWFLWAKLIGKEGKKCQIGDQTGEIRHLHAQKWVFWSPTHTTEMSGICRNVHPQTTQNRFFEIFEGSEKFSENFFF